MAIETRPPTDDGPVMRYVPHRLRPSRRPLPGTRGEAERTDRLVKAQSDEERHDGADDAHYHPPQSPDEDGALWLGLKVALAMLVADAVARSLGFEERTWSVLTAAFLATSPPVAGVNAAFKKLVALAIGITLGALGAWSAIQMSGVTPLHFGAVGLVAGVLGSRSPDYLFAAVVGTVVTFVGSGGGGPLPEIVTATACTVIIGCLIGPMAAWAVERVKRWRFERSAA